SIVITSSSGLSDSEIDKMVKEAQAHEEEDKKKREIVEVRNEADQFIYTTEKFMKENREKVKPELMDDVNKAIKYLKDIQMTDNFEDIKNRLDAAKQAFYRISNDLYSQASEQQGPPKQEQPEQENTKNTKENAEEADYEVVDDKDKKK
ncbi:MAG: molecular chaperone DnaK, partial [bacterium (Candidatus Stahlbacteria) CG23_combo_of_CG06-09_8_20_14_all_34_7]